MTAYPDTSFLCSLYRKQAFSTEALAYRAAMTETLHVTELLQFEFFQAIELQVFLHANDRTKGYPRSEAQAITLRWNQHLAGGSAKIVTCNMDAVIRQAQQLALVHTAAGGHRSLDVLHVATAVHLGAKEFLSFDQRQIALAKSLGLGTPFA
jgi:predicted nucleic acid-binding protein